MSEIRVTLRDAEAVDLAALAQLHVRAFNQTHGPGPDASVRERQWREKFGSPSKLLFCVVLEAREGDLVGFASGETHHGPELAEYSGVLDKIYLVREYHRQGLGRMLICAAAQRFVDRGVDSMLLFGDAQSPTNGFYEAMGGERLYSGSGEFHGGYGWPDLAKLAVLCSGT